MVAVAAAAKKKSQKMTTNKERDMLFNTTISGGGGGASAATHRMRFQPFDGNQISANGATVNYQTIEYTDGEALAITVSGTDYIWSLRVDDGSTSGGTTLVRGSGRNGSTVNLFMPNQDVVFVAWLD